MDASMGLTEMRLSTKATEAGVIYFDILVVNGSMAEVTMDTGTTGPILLICVVLTV